jgi:hypothetical protein
MATDVALGERMHSFGLVLRGSLADNPHPPEQAWISFLHSVAKAIGMQAVAEPVVFTYPIDGKGGTGQSLFLPITESFLALDTWDDHDGAYLFVCSCRPFDRAVIDAAARQYGLEPARNGGGRFYAELNLK